MSILLSTDALPAVRNGVRNFAWVVPGEVARGEQPDLTDGALGALRDAGITTLLSLREDQEPTLNAPPYASTDGRTPYSSADERAASALCGLRFYHIPVADLHAPSPAQVAHALDTLGRATAAGQVVYLHCHAGVGRTGVLAAAWAMRRGASGDWAAAQFVSFFDDLFVRRGIPPEERAACLAQWTVAHQLWVVERLAHAFGTKVTEPLPGYPAPARPPYGDGWEFEPPAGAGRTHAPILAGV